MLKPDIVSVGKFDSLISAARNIAVVTHTHPDGDAFGSAGAMCRYLESRGRNVRFIMVENVPDNLDFLVEGLTLYGAEALSECDLVAVLDLNSLNRTGELESALRSCKAPKVLVDHHLNPHSDEFDLVFSTPEVSSASEHLYWILKEMSGGTGNIPLKCLESLLTGMTTDTNNFANSVFPSTLAMTSEILEAGVDRDRITGLLYKRDRINRIKAFAYFLGEKLVVRGGLAYIVIEREELDRFDIREGELDGLVNEALRIGDVKISITAKQDGDFWRLSLRSKPEVSANSIAMEFFNGGGHFLAAGGRLPIDVKVAEYIEQVVKI